MTCLMAYYNDAKFNLYLAYAHGACFGGKITPSHAAVGWRAFNPNGGERSSVTFE